VIVQLEHIYTLKLTGAEFRLMTLALSGKLTRKEDMKEVLQLNERLCALRAHELTMAAQIADGAHNQAVALLNAVTLDDNVSGS
jgi:hypothetical protein